MFHLITYNWGQAEPCAIIIPFIACHWSLRLPDPFGWLKQKSESNQVVSHVFLVSQPLPECQGILLPDVIKRRQQTGEGIYLLCCIVVSQEKRKPKQNKPTKPNSNSKAEVTNKAISSQFSEGKRIHIYYQCTLLHASPALVLQLWYAFNHEGLPLHW